MYIPNEESASDKRINYRDCECKERLMLGITLEEYRALVEASTEVRILNDRVYSLSTKCADYEAKLQKLEAKIEKMEMIENE